MRYLNLIVPTALFAAYMGGCAMTDVQTEQNFAENEPVVFMLGTSHVASAKSATPSSFHILGHIENGQFVPDSDILGEGSFEAQGQRGWLELKSSKFYPMHTAQSPNSPYVEGAMTKNGFVPSSRAIK